VEVTGIVVDGEGERNGQDDTPATRDQAAKVLERRRKILDVLQHVGAEHDRVVRFGPRPRLRQSLVYPRHDVDASAAVLRDVHADVPTAQGLDQWAQRLLTAAGL